MRQERKTSVDTPAHNLQRYTSRRSVGAYEMVHGLYQHTRLFACIDGGMLGALTTIAARQGASCLKRSGLFISQ